MEPAPNTEALDQQFKEFIQALKKAVGAGIPHLKDDPKIVDQSIADFSQRYADQNERDYQDFVKAVTTGRLEAIEGV